MQQRTDTATEAPPADEGHTENENIGSFEELLKLDPTKVKSIKVLPRDEK